MIFKKPNSKLLSFYGTNNRKVTLDYILISSKHKSSCKDCFSKMHPTISSDHNLIVSKIKWTLQSNKNKVIINVKRDYDLFNGYISENDTNGLKAMKYVENTISEYKYDNTLGVENYNILSETIMKATNSVCPPFMRINKKQPWVDLEITYLQQQLNNNRMLYLQKRKQLSSFTHSDLHEQYNINNKALRSDLKALYNSKEESYRTNLCNEIISATSDDRYN